MSYQEAAARLWLRLLSDAGLIEEPENVPGVIAVILFFAVLVGGFTYVVHRLNKSVDRDREVMDTIWGDS